MKTVLSSDRSRIGLKMVLPFGLLAAASLSPAFTFNDPTMGAFFYAKSYVKFGTLSSTSVFTTSSGGNPGSGMGVYHTIAPGEITAVTALAFGSAYTIPSTGLSHVNMGVDYRSLSEDQFGTAYFGFALEQGSKRYAAMINESPFAPYSTISASGLTANDFAEIDVVSGDIVNLSSHPDFSLVGSNLKFGVFSYATTNTFADSITTNFDNLHVNAVAAVPEPTSILAASVGLFGIARSRRRRK